MWQNWILAQGQAVAQTTAEWSTIGVISGIVFAVVGATVTVLIALLKLVVGQALSDQNVHLQKEREEMLNKLRDEFLEKKQADREISRLEERIKDLHKKLERND